MRKKPKVVAFRRVRQGKTDYRKRLKFLSAGKPRLVIRVTLSKIIGQIIGYNPEGDKVLAGLSSQALEKLGWQGSKKNLPAAYLTGYLLAKEAVKKGVKEVILDIGFKPSIKGNKIYACVAGAIEGGLGINCDKEMLPAEDRIKGKHIKPEIEKMFEEVKKKI
ncbi:MAG: 50S ribosomal protein L18 [Nanoarchaeota archaeon]|nr:50S ribosomal protein L18 [Nanoarchaeota archaeon]